VPAVQHAVRSAIYWGRESWAIGFTRRPELLKLAQRNAERHLYRQIKDPELRAKLRPSYVMGCKRVLISTDFYPALAQPNADVITEGIEEITANGIRTRDGVEHEVDAIIFGTGFHVTDLPFADRVHGRDGVALSDAWADGMEAYLGTTVPGFPNLFLVIGPNTGLGHTSMVFMIESQLAYIVDALRWMDRSGNDVVEVRPEVTHRYNEALQRRMGRTIWSVGGCKSWYVDEHGRNTTLWPGFTFEFRRRTRHFRPEKYVAAARHRAAEQVAV
jgi:cation diffusion facilitator CzcD-associated flavoprotein CzcO